MALTQSEVEQLAGLLGKIEWPMPKEVFYALLRCTVSVPIELAVIDDKGYVLMFYRKDEEYDGYHMPGTVLRDNEDVSNALRRLLASELVGANISAPQNIGWIEIPRGSGHGENPTRHEISLIFLARLHGEYQGKGGEFFPIHKLPKNTLPHHVTLIQQVRASQK